MSLIWFARCPATSLKSCLDSRFGPLANTPSDAVSGVV